MVVSLLKAPLLTDHQTRADFPGAGKGADEQSLIPTSSSGENICNSWVEF